MKFHIPFTFSSLERQKKRKILFKKLIRHKKKSKLQFYLDNCEVKITREQYLNIVWGSFFTTLVLVFIVSSAFLLFYGIRNNLLISLGLAILFSSFIFFAQTVYPKIYSSRKDKDIERNLIPALQDMVVQLNSGVPLFSIMINISSSNYGKLSDEFKKIVIKINTGYPQIEVLEEAGEKSSSLFFRRTLWQISNGMKAGSDVSIVIKESIKTLTEEQLIQIQTYGNKLNPLIMFYMMLAVILPALAITFLTIVSSLVGLPRNTTILMYIGLFVVVMFAQVMFLGIIRSSRPSLL